MAVHGPACGHSPTDGRQRDDGDIGIGRGCGTQEVGAGVDIEAPWAALAAIDTMGAARRSEASGLGDTPENPEAVENAHGIPQLTGTDPNRNAS